MTEDLSENYRDAFANHLEAGDKPALLIVDVVMAYLDPDSSLYAKAEAALESNVRLRQAASAAGIPVIFTRLDYRVDGADGGLFLRKIPAAINCPKSFPARRFSTCAAA